MADNNVLRIRVGVAFDPREIAREANRAIRQAEQMRQGTNGNIRESEAGRRGQDALTGATTRANTALRNQNSIWGLMTQNIRGTIANFLKFTVVSSVFMAVTVTMRAMLGLMFELDEAYTNLKIVSGATAEEMALIDQRVGDLSISLGRLKKEVVDATTEFLRAGYGIDASMTLAENAIKGANVGAVDLADVTTYLIAGLRAFNFEAEESSRILDVLFQVSNKTAIDLEGIGEAFLRSANTLKAAGATLEEAAALIAGANESVQDPAKVGTALKTIATRLRGVSEDGEVVPTLEKDFKKLGIEVRNSEGGFRNIYDIFKELSVAIKGVDDLTKQSILEKLAGKRQVNIMQGLLNDFDVVEMSLEEGMSSFGKVSEAQEIAIQSLNGKIGILKESVGQLLTAMSDSEGLKVFLDVLTAIVKGLTSFVNVLADIPDLLKILAGAIAVFIGLAGEAVVYMGAIGGALIAFNPWLIAIGAGVAVLSAFSMAGKDAKQSQEELNEELKRTTELQGDFSKKFLKSSEQEQRKMALSIRDTIASLRALREEQENNPSRSGKLLEDMGNGTDAEEIRLEIERLTKSLLDLGFSEKDATRWMEEYGNSAVNAYDRTKTFTETLAMFRNEIRASVNDTELLVDARNQMNDTGVIELDTLDSLLVSHSEFADVLGTTKEAQLAYLETLINGNIEGDKLEKQKLENDKLRLVERLKLFQTEILGRKEVLKSYGSNGFFASKIAGAFTSVLDNLATKKEKADLLEIENAEKRIAELTNSIGLQENLTKIKDESAKKEEKILTAQERALADVNYQIELQQKLIAQLSGAEKESAQQKLILLYEKEKLALIAVRDSLNKTKLGADEYGNQVRDLSLKIEDANISILGLNKEILDTRSAMAQSKIDEYTKEVESLATKMDKAFQSEIDNLKKAQEKSDAYYEKRIESIDEEIDSINKANEATEDKLELEKALLDLQKLREERQAILDNKNVRRVNDANVGYENIADPRELKRIEEEILDAESQVQDIRKEQAEKAVIDELEAKKVAIEKEQKLESEKYDKSIEALELYQTQMNDEIALGGQLTQTIVGNALMMLGQLEDQSYANRLSAVSDYVKSYNAQMSQISGLESIISTNTGIVTANKLPTSGITTGAISTGLKVTGSSGATNAVKGSVVGNKTGTVNTGTTFNNTKIVVPNTSAMAKRFIDGGRTVE